MLVAATQPRIKRQKPVVGIRKGFGNKWVLPATANGKVEETFSSSRRRKENIILYIAISPLKQVLPF